MVLHAIDAPAIGNANHSIADNSVAMKANMKIIKPMEGMGKRGSRLVCGQI